MNQQIVIDAIVRQTMILVARLSTVDGVRSPLSHVVDEVFLGLVNELEEQGLGKKVIADMFGLALRSYRQKSQRLRESASTRGVSLWNAMHTHLSDEGPCSRDDLLQHFKRDEDISVRGILRDLVESGLVLKVGGTADPRYRIATKEELEDLGAAASSRPVESNAAVIWLLVYRDSPINKHDLRRSISMEDEAFTEAVNSLVVDGQIRVEHRGDEELYVSEKCLIPLGQSVGWEAALIDHHRTILNALAAKITHGAHSSAAKDEVGGTTLSFDVWPGHPHEKEVRQLLSTTRQDVIGLWDKVSKYNKTQDKSQAYQVSFYVGQYVQEVDE